MAKDVTKRLIEIAEELSAISEEQNIRVDVVIYHEGCYNVRFGDYEIWKHGADKEVYANYNPHGNIRAWKNCIPIESVRIGQAPALESEEENSEENIKTQA